MAGVGEGDGAGLDVEDADPGRDEHVGGVVAAEFGVYLCKRLGGVAEGEKRILDERLGRHHVECGGDALAGDVRDEEGVVGVVEREVVVEVAADLFCGLHCGVELEVGVDRQGVRKRGRLDGLGDFHVLRAGGLLGGVEGLEAVGVHVDAAEEEDEDGEDNREDDRHDGGVEGARAVVLSGREAGDDAVTAVDCRAAVAEVAEETLTEGGLAVFAHDRVIGVVARLGEELRLVAVAGGIGDEVSVGDVGAKVEARASEQPAFEDEVHDRGEHLRDMRLVDADLDEAVALGEGDADILAAEFRIVRPLAERL